MLSSIFLAFEDAEMKKNFEAEKIQFYNRTLFILTMTMILLTAGLAILDFGLQLYTSDPMTHGVNGGVTVMCLLLWILVGRCYSASFFVCPMLTAYVFYYFAFVDFDGTNVSIYYTMIVAITASYFILIIFNENWLFSSIVYAPLISFYMHKTGQEMVGSEINELIIRCIFCVFIYTVSAYKLEVLNKRAYLGTQSQENAFYRWLKIFETFPEGLALVRRGQIMYANRSFPEVFEFNDYMGSQDMFNEELRRLLTETEVTRLGAEDEIYNTNPWDFLDMEERGAPFSFSIDATRMKEDNPEMQRNADNTYTKYISMNKVDVNVAGSEDKLFVVRDLNSMVNLQKFMYLKKHLQIFTEKVVRQIQEASEVSLMNLQRLDNHCDDKGRGIAEETLNETKRILHRIVDFEQVYNISQGTFLQVQTNFKVADIFNQIKTVTQQDFSKRNNQVIFEVEPTVPTFIRAPMVIFRQLLLNIIATIVAGSFRSVITISARSETHDQSDKTLVITVANKKNSFSKDQIEQIEDLCEEDDLVRILESLEAVDVNFVIALIMARQNGWPLDFQSDASGCKFMVEVDCQAAGAPSLADINQLGDRRGLVKGGRPSLLRMPSMTNVIDNELDSPEKRSPLKKKSSQIQMQAFTNLVKRMSNLQLLQNVEDGNQSETQSPEPQKEGWRNSIKKRLSKLLVTDGVSPTKQLESPTKLAPVMERGDGPDCLLVSCSDLVPLFEKGLGFKCDESFLEESAVNSVGRSIKKGAPYRFIFVDLDDPTLLLGRFVTSINKLLASNPKVTIQIYACSSNSSERVIKKCKEVNVSFIAKPMTKDKLIHLKKIYQ